MKQLLDDFIFPDTDLIQEVFYLIADDEAEKALRIWTEANSEGVLPDAKFIEGIILSKIPGRIEEARELLWNSYDTDDDSFRKSLHWMEFVGAHCNPQDAKVFVERKVTDWGEDSVRSLTLVSCYSLFDEDIAEYLHLTRRILNMDLHPEDARWLYTHACEVICGYKLFEENEDLIKNAIYRFPTDMPFVVTWLYLLLTKKDYARLTELAKTEVDSALPDDLRFSLAAVLMEGEDYNLAQLYLEKIRSEETAEPSKSNLLLLCSRSLEQLDSYKKTPSVAELDSLKSNLREWKIWAEMHSSEEEYQRLSLTHRDLITKIADKLEIVF